MKRILSVVVAVMILTSCSSHLGCPGYGNTNKMTKYGSKAQAKYGRKHHRI